MKLATFTAACVCLCALASAGEPTIATKNGGLEVEVDDDKSIVFRKRRLDVDIHVLAETVDKLAANVAGGSASLEKTVATLTDTSEKRMQATERMVTTLLSTSIVSLDTKSKAAVAKVEKSASDATARIKTATDKMEQTLETTVKKSLGGVATCSKKGSAYDADTGKCVASKFDAVLFTPVTKGTGCGKDAEGKVVYDKSLKALMVCSGTQFVPVVPVDLGSQKWHPAADCKALKAAGFGAAGEYWVLKKDAKGNVVSTKSFCYDGADAVPGMIKSVPGKSCKSIKDQLKDKAKSGLFWVNPAGKEGETLQVWCEHEWKGGGWTLFMHVHRYCARDERSKYAQSFALWEKNGINKDKVEQYYKSTKPYAHKSCYFLPLKHWLTYATTESSKGFTQLAFMGEKASNQHVSMLTGFKTDSKYALRGDNRGTVQREMCNGDNNCFVNDWAKGFSASDRNNGRSDCRRSYGQVGWWYAACYTYNPHEYNGNYGHFTGYTRIRTSHWSWLAR